MTPVFQTRFGDPEGNCTEACLASLLDIPLEEVPDLLPTRHVNWFAQLDAWLATRGLGLVFVELTDNKSPIFLMSGINFIAGGPAQANGVRHYAIYTINKEKHWELVHDPHREWAGITHVEDVLFIIKRT